MKKIFREIKAGKDVFVKKGAAQNQALLPPVGAAAGQNGPSEPVHSAGAASSGKQKEETS